MITAYRDPHRHRGRDLRQQLIDSASVGVPTALFEVAALIRENAGLVTLAGQEPLSGYPRGRLRL